MSYDLITHIEREHGSGTNMLREDTFSQPQALRKGDVLANGLVIAERNEAGNGGKELSFDNGSRRVVAARIPLLLEGGTSGKLPSELEVGDILQTGCVVLAQPTKIGQDDREFEANRRETKIHISGGHSGHSIGVPSDLIIALHPETYPPAPVSLFGAFVIHNTLDMGARARRNLPNYGRLTSETEFERVSSVFKEIAALRATGQEQRDAYQETVAALQEQCKQLKGVELLISGLLGGRGGTTIPRDNPRAWVENLHVEISQASVNTYEGTGSLLAQHLPFIEFYGHTVVDNEQVSGKIGAGEFGVEIAVAGESDQK